MPPLGYTPFTQDPWQWFLHLIFPWITLSILYIGFYARVLRADLLEVQNDDFVRTAKAKGLSPRSVLVRHMLRTSLITFVSLFGLDFGVLVGGGALLTEVVFGLPGRRVADLQLAALARPARDHGDGDLRRLLHHDHERARRHRLRAPRPAHPTRVVELRVCVAEVAPVRAEPDEGAEQVTQALAGEPLAVESAEDGWARIRTAYGYPGWIREDALGGEPDGEWPGLPRAGDPVERGPRLPRHAVRVGRADRRAGSTAPGSCTWPTGGSGDSSRATRTSRRRRRKRSRRATCRPGDLVFFGPPERADHIAFWLGEGRILHATGRDGVHAVVEEPLANVRGEHELRYGRL